MIGYKGFNSDMTCRGKQYEVGKTYHEDETVICEKGMHFCTDPLGVFKYYNPSKNSRYCLVEADNVSDDVEYSKRVCKDLKIIKEIPYDEYIKLICHYYKNKNSLKDRYIYVFKNNTVYNFKKKNDVFIYTIFSDNNIINMRYNDYTMCDVYGNDSVISIYKYDCKYQKYNINMGIYGKNNRIYNCTSESRIFRINNNFINIDSESSVII